MTLLDSFARPTQPNDAAIAPGSSAVWRRRDAAIWSAIAFCGLLLVMFGERPACAASSPSLVKGLVAWYDASDSTTMSTAQGVAQWNDRSGQGNNLTPITAGVVPTLQASTLNGLPTILFANSAVTVGEALVDTAFTPTTMPATTIFIVHAVQSMPAGYGRTLGFWNGSGDSVTGIDIGSPNVAQASFDVRWIEGEYPVGGSYQTNLRTGSTPFGTYVLERDQASSTNVNVAVNGTLEGTRASTTAGPIATSEFGIGTSMSGSYLSSDESIAEVVIYNVALSTTNMQLIEGYLACKWGLQGSLPAGHPYKSTCPSGSNTPTTVSGLVGWYDASDSSTITTATAVAQWNDKSSLGNNVTPQSAGVDPTLQATTLNGLSTIRFPNPAVTGVDALVDTAFTPTTMTATTIFIVHAVQSMPAGFGRTLGFWSGSNDYIHGIDIGAPGAAQASFDVRYIEGAYPIGGSSQTNLLTASTAFGTYVLERDQASSTNVNVAVNGTLEGTRASTTAGPIATSEFGIGTSMSGSYLSSNESIAEVVIYNQTLARQEYQFVEGYLACKWGLQASLPASHPYRSFCPSGTRSLSLVLAVSTTTPTPGTDVTYTQNYTNNGGSIDYNPVMTIPVPAATYFKLGSASSSVGTTGLSPALSYSKDNGSTYTYTPVSGAGGAPTGYDGLVNDVKWTCTGALPPAPPDNSGSASLTVHIP